MLTCDDCRQSTTGACFRHPPIYLGSTAAAVTWPPRDLTDEEVDQLIDRLLPRLEQRLRQARRLRGERV